MPNDKNNFKKAPTLLFSQEKKLEPPYYSLPQDITDKIFQKLGNSSAQLRIMIVLVGTKHGFGISEKWILDRTGLNSGSYNRARDELVKKGFITHEDYKYIRVNFQKIME